MCARAVSTSTTRMRSASNPSGSVARRPEGRDERPRGDEQHQRQRDLEDHETSGSGAGRCALAAFSQRVDRCGTRCAERRTGAEQHGGQHGHDRGGGQHAPVERQVERDPRVGRRETADHEPTRPRGEDQARGRAQPGEQEAFRQQLPRELPARAPERQPDAHLVAARRGAHHQQVRDVHARHQQDEHDDGEDRQQRPGVDPPQAGPVGCAGRCRHENVGILQHRRQLPRRSAGESENVRLHRAKRRRRRVHRLSGREPEHGGQHQRRRMVQRGARAADDRLHGQREGDVERLSDLDPEEVRRHDADHRARDAVDRQRRADDIGGAVESPLPQRGS